jgi:hypothetical protein
MGTVANLIMHNGHCGEFGYALQATAVDLVKRYEL